MHRKGSWEVIRHRVRRVRRVDVNKVDLADCEDGSLPSVRRTWQWSVDGMAGGKPKNRNELSKPNPNQG